MYTITFEPGWDENFVHFAPDIREQVSKKILKLAELEGIRHLKFGLPLFVVNVGQYRICFRQTGLDRKIIFVGNHKQYEKWYSSI